MAGSRTRSVMDPKVICPAVTAVVQPILTAQFPSLTLVGVTIETEAGQPHLWVAIEETAAGFRNTPLTPEDVQALPKISLETCEAVSRAINEPLDTIPELAGASYNLDVGSPGAFRQLITPEECAFYAGWPVTCQTDPKKSGKRRPEAILGHLGSSTTDVTLTDAAGETHSWPLTALRSGEIELSLNPPLTAASVTE